MTERDERGMPISHPQSPEEKVAEGTRAPRATSFPKINPGQPSADTGGVQGAPALTSSGMAGSAAEEAAAPAPASGSMSPLNRAWPCSAPPPPPLRAAIL